MRIVATIDDGLDEKEFVIRGVKHEPACGERLTVRNAKRSRGGWRQVVVSGVTRGHDKAIYQLKTDANEE